MKVYHGQNRKAEILQWGSGAYAYYIVRLWEHDRHVEDRRMITDDLAHSLSYAQDCAVNWVDNVF
jgi:hypothetical protein